MTLYDLTAEALDLQAVILDAGGEVTPDVEAALDALDALGETAEDKLAAYGRLIANMAADADAYRAEEKRLADRRKAIETSARSLKDRVEQFLRATGKPKIKADVWSFSLQRNPPSVYVRDTNAIPADYLVPQQPTIDRRAILDVLKAGGSVPGCELQQGESLRIR